MSKVAAIIGRILIALIFIWSGANKLLDLTATETAMVGAGLPGGLALFVGLFELVAGICLAAGFMVRLVSVLLAGFSALTILFFHHNVADPAQLVNAFKNLAIIGGLFLAFAHSQMWSHYYAIKAERRGEVLARDAEARVRDAELRAARAEGEVAAIREGVQPTPVATSATYVDTDDDGIPDRRRRWFDW